MEAFSTVAPASRRLSRGHPALAGGGGTPPRQPPGRRRYRERLRLKPGETEIVQIRDTLLTTFHVFAP